MRELLPLHPEFPRELGELKGRYRSLWLDGHLDLERERVGIVGARAAGPEVIAFVEEIAEKLARAGRIVVSGGALGVDSAAHRGAMRAGPGSTWVVAPSGREHPFPPTNADFFKELVASGNTILSQYPPDTPPMPARFLARNRVLVTLCKTLIVAQAGPRSGALNAATWARRLQKDLWIVPGPPWLEGFEGSYAMLDRGLGRVLRRKADLYRSLGVAHEPAPALPDVDLTPEQAAVLKALDFGPRHLDEIIASTGLGAPAVSTALLTLALENVVVEDPPSATYRRRSI